MALGTVWEPAAWADDTWADDTWADSEAASPSAPPPAINSTRFTTTINSAEFTIDGT